MSSERRHDPPHPPNTNSDRFAAVVDCARAVIDELTAVFDVARLEGEWADDFPRLAGNADGPTIHLTPSTGVPLVLGFTDLPGVAMRVGPNVELMFPDCGCDLCNEQVDDLCDELRLYLDAVTLGGFREGLTRRWHSYEFALLDGHRRASKRRRKRGEQLPDSTRGWRRWEPWQTKPSV